MKKFLIIIQIILILILGNIIYCKFIQRKAIIKILGMARLTVLTGSMEPEISVNNKIIIKEYLDYNIGDIVTYIQEGEIITHRVIEKEGEYYYTKGDNNNTIDKPIIKEQIEGKVIYILK